ncbi:MAG: hypothetical protein ABEK04_04500 [Candidatus Nanohalobium sp.]
MKERNRKALVYSAAGVLAVIASAFITNLFAPHSRIGEGLRFFVPLITGVVAGVALFLKLSGYSSDILEEVPGTEDEA